MAKNPWASRYKWTIHLMDGSTHGGPGHVAFSGEDSIHCRCPGGKKTLIFPKVNVHHYERELVAS